MLDFWGWLIGEERPRCVPQGVRRVSLLNRLASPIRESRGVLVICRMAEPLLPFDSLIRGEE